MMLLLLLLKQKTMLNLVLVNQKSEILKEEAKGGKENPFHMFQDGGGAAMGTAVQIRRRC